MRCKKPPPLGQGVHVEQHVFVRNSEAAGEFLLHVSSLKADYACLNSKPVLELL